jgi:hypothetical protein
VSHASISGSTSLVLTWPYATCPLGYRNLTQEVRIAVLPTIRQLVGIWTGIAHAAMSQQETKLTLNQLTPARDASRKRSDGSFQHR